MRESAVLDDLRARIAQIEGTDGQHDAIPFGIESIDCRLPGGGIATGTLHEIAGSTERHMAGRGLEEHKADHVRASIQRDLKGLARGQAANFDRK